MALKKTSYSAPVTKVNTASPDHGKTVGDKQVVPNSQGTGPRPRSVESRYGKK